MRIGHLHRMGLGFRGKPILLRWVWGLKFRGDPIFTERASGLGLRGNLIFIGRFRVQAFRLYGQLHLYRMTFGFRGTAISAGWLWVYGCDEILSS